MQEIKSLEIVKINTLIREDLVQHAINISGGEYKLKDIDQLSEVERKAVFQMVKDLDKYKADLASGSTPVLQQITLLYVDGDRVYTPPTAMADIYVEYL